MVPPRCGAARVLCAALFLDGLDISMVGVALPSIGADLDMSTVGAAVDRQRVRPRLRRPAAARRAGGRSARPPPGVPRRARPFRASRPSSAASSTTARLLIALRFVKGLAAAFTAPAGLSIITTTFAEGPARNRALSHVHGLRRERLLAGPGLRRPAHRARLALDIPAARRRSRCCSLFAGLRLLPRAARRRRARRLRPARRGHQHRPRCCCWSTPSSRRRARAGRGLATLGLARRRRRACRRIRGRRAARTPHPLIRLGILRSAGSIRANLAGAALFGAYVAFQFLVTLYLQNAARLVAAADGARLPAGRPPGRAQLDPDGSVARARSTPGC